MRFSIISEIPGRTRLQLAGPVPESDLDALLKLSGDIDGVRKVRVYGRIGQMALEYDERCRAGVLDALGALDAQAIADAKTGYVMQLEPRKHKLVMDLATLIGAHYARRWFLPTPLRAVFVVVGYMAFLRAALHELAQPRLTVPVLDASAIGISFVKRDVDTAGQTMFLLNVGELLEDYTRAMSENELINSLLDVPDKAQKVVGDTEVSVAATELEPGDLVAVRTGMSICIDGVVEQGSAMVNQATLTGEPLAVERSVGDDVFAGTVVEDGSILVRVRANTAQTKLRSIVSLVQTADSLKSEGQSHMEDLANKIVPWNFLLAGLVALTTRSLIKTSAALMVDYSCALKLTGSVAVMTAMSDAAKMGVMVKGAKYFESFAKADTIVFDKTGTLTEAQPRLACVLTTDGWSEDEVLRLSACLEEHFPHPVARAVVNAARERGLEHRERHAAVEYIVAHGIASSIEGRRAIIGSAHFVFEDESAQLDSDIKERIESRCRACRRCIWRSTARSSACSVSRTRLSPGSVRPSPTCMRWASSMSLCSRAIPSARPSALRERRVSTSLRPSCCPRTSTPMWSALRARGATLPWWATASTIRRRSVWPTWDWRWVAEATSPRRSPISS